MKKRKVAFLHVSFPDGGAERITMDIINYISSFNYESYIFTCNLESEKLPTESVNSFKPLLLPDPTNVDSVENADFIIHSLDKNEIDIFILPHYELVTLSYIRSRTHCKIVFAHHGVPLWEVENELSIMKRKSARNFPKKLEWHLLRYPKYKLLGKFEKKYLEKYRKIYDTVDAYTVLCDEYKKKLISKLGVQSENNKIRVIHNSERLVAEVNLNKKKQILFVGRMTYADKRIDRLLKIWELACSDLPDWELVLVGDGPERATLQQKAVEMELPRISFEGYSNKVGEYYSQATVLCLTSTFEGWGLCLTEAQAHGVIPFAFGCSAGVKEILSPSGVNGYIIPPFSIRKYARSLVALLNNPSRIKEMQMNVIQKSKKYSTEAVGLSWLCLFDSLFVSQK
ncbi:glycosyltransferase [Bacteroides graminisolvens]|uniref:glycosyltransferase n=1 Tax=Bacteroides graminisolvens TaxID=477666 RepID=UPI0029C61D0B|nr:glycosyltransferase [Bacteroides graminisolvens]